MNFTRTFAQASSSVFGLLTLLGSANASAWEVTPNFYKMLGSIKTETLTRGEPRLPNQTNMPLLETQTYVAAPPRATAATLFTLVADVFGTVAPTAKVKFYDGTKLLGSAPTDPTTGFATLSIKTPMLMAPVVGTHSITATYVGNAQTKMSNSNNTASLNVIKSTFVDVRPNPVGQHNRFEASMNVGGKSPTGTVDFYNTGENFNTAQVDSASGIASTTGYSNGVVSELITASYPGDAQNPGSTTDPFYLTAAQLSYGVAQQIVASQLSVGANRPLRISVFIKASTDLGSRPLPNSYVSEVFYDGSTYLGIGTYDQTLGVAVLNTSLATVGVHSLTATFLENGIYLRNDQKFEITVTP